LIQHIPIHPLSQSIPTLEIPLHTLIELRPRPDGTMDLEYVPLPQGESGLLFHEVHEED
jgi:hypothetical protein